MPRVEVFSWNPRRSRLPRAIAKHLRTGRPVNNFGDLLGPLLVERILAMHGIDPNAATDDRRLLSVGSVLHFARDHDVIWGTGVNGKIADIIYIFQSLDVRAVRGPRTHAFLQSRGVPTVAPELVRWSRSKQYPITVVPNFNEFSAYRAISNVLDPRSPVEVCLRRLAQSEFVVGSSLHAIVVAESLGIPARLIASSIEDPLKYDDYYLGTGRRNARIASTVEDAVTMGGEVAPTFDAGRLLGAFPFDLWRGP
jgi:pyruvyltransferase